jgi:hypothetical protein
MRPPSSLAATTRAGALQFGGEFDSLRFAARQFSCGLAEPQVARADFGEIP